MSTAYNNPPPPPRQEPRIVKEGKQSRPQFPNNRIYKNPYRTLFWLLIAIVIANIVLFLVFMLKISRYANG